MPDISTDANSTNKISKLFNGQEIPSLTLGTYGFISESDCYEAILNGLDMGYRSFDTAVYYNTEEILGKALKSSGTNRDSMFITSKVWEDEQGYDKTLLSFEKSLKRLQTDYLDLYLIHRPIKSLSIDTYRALIYLHEQGVLRSVGVSNFTEGQIDRLIEETGVTPVLNQIEMHPHNTRQELHSYHLNHSILTQSWRPLGQGKLLSDPTVITIAEKYEKTPAQILLSWSLCKNASLVVKASSNKHLQDNMKIFDFKLTHSNIKLLDSLNRNLTYASRDINGHEQVL